MISKHVYENNYLYTGQSDKDNIKLEQRIQVKSSHFEEMSFISNLNGRAVRMYLSASSPADIPKKIYLDLYFPLHYGSHMSTFRSYSSQNQF